MATASSPTGTSTSTTPADVREDETLYTKLWWAGFAFNITLVLLAIPCSFVTVGSGVFTMHLGTMVLMGACAYLWLSLKTVGADEIGGALFYGKALKKLSSGLHFAPWGLMQVRPAPSTVRQFQGPGEPEDVQKTDDSVALEPGKVRPIRAVTRAPLDSENRILDAQMTLMLGFVIQYQIVDIFDFLRNYGTVEEVERQLRDIGETLLGEEASRNTPNSFIEKLRRLNKSLTKRTVERFQNSGVNIVSTRVNSPDVSHSVSSDLAGIPSAHAKAEQVKAASTGRRVQLINEGQGAAQAEKDLLIARAEGRKKMMDDLKVSGDAVLASEAAREVLKETDVLMLGGESGVADVMKIMKGAQTALNTGKGGTTT